jgi:peptidoglycan-associated lipoprotein
MIAQRNCLFAALLSGLVACSSTQEFPDEAEGETQGPPPGESEGATREDAPEGAEAGAAAGAERYEGEALDDPESPLSQRVFYFEFDSSELSDQALETLKAHGKYLATHPERNVIIEGHTDERGSREYNLALGEGRAESVARVLKLNGAADDQIETVSYGEEKPAAPGHNEEAWAENRRAELIYTNR